MPRRTSRSAPGSRRGAEVERCLKRELISRAYNRLLRLLLHLRCSDAQCGFKAARREALVPLLDRIESQTWFFDTELLHLAEREGLTIFELPVRWIEDRDSSVRIVVTAIENLRGIARLRADLIGRAAAAGSRGAGRSATATDHRDPKVAGSTWSYRTVRNTGRCPACGNGLRRSDDAAQS